MTSLKHITAAIRASACHPFHREAKHAVPGEGPARAKIMLVGEAPGKSEDATGRPFIGRAGKFLDAELQATGLARKRLFITSVLKYYPPYGKVSRADVTLSLPWLQAQIHAIHPDIVLLMGNVAQSIEPDLPDGPQYLTTVHPAAAMRFPKYRKKFRHMLQLLARLRA